MKPNDGFSNGHIFLIHVVNTISITQNLKLVQKLIYYELGRRYNLKSISN